MMGMTDWSTYQVWRSIIPIAVVFSSIALVFAYILMSLYCKAIELGHKARFFRSAKFLLGGGGGGGGGGGALQDVSQNAWSNEQG